MSPWVYKVVGMRVQAEERNDAAVEGRALVGNRRTRGLSSSECFGILGDHLDSSLQ